MFLSLATEDNLFGSFVSLLSLFLKTVLSLTVAVGRIGVYFLCFLSVSRLSQIYISLRKSFVWIPTCSLALYWPQIYKNYKLKSADGISIHFIYILLLSDLYNLTWMLTMAKIMTILHIYEAYVSSKSLHFREMRTLI